MGGGCLGGCLGLWHQWRWRRSASILSRVRSVLFLSSRSEYLSVFVLLSVGFVGGSGSVSCLVLLLLSCLLVGVGVLLSCCLCRLSSVCVDLDLCSLLRCVGGWLVVFGLGWLVWHHCGWVGIMVVPAFIAKLAVGSISAHFTINPLLFPEFVSSVVSCLFNCVQNVLFCELAVSWCSGYCDFCFLSSVLDDDGCVVFGLYSAFLSSLSNHSSCVLALD